MENEDTNPNAALIASFCEITSATKPEAAFFLESHNFDLDAAVSTFFDNNNTITAAPPPTTTNRSPSNSPDYSPSDSPSRSRSPSPPPATRTPYDLRGRRGGGEPGKGGTSRSSAGGVRTLSDLNRMTAEGSDSDDEDHGQEYYTGGEKSGMLVQDPNKVNDVEAIFNQARQSGGVARPPVDLNPSSSRSKSFTGTARLLSGETLPSAPSSQHPEFVNHSITFWRNGFTIDDGPLRRLDDPENASFLESIRKSECPEELRPSDHRTAVHVDLVRRDEDYKEAKRPQKAFQGAGRTLGSSSSAILASSETVAATSFTAAPLPQEGLIVDESSPSTSIQLRLADGTRMVSRFNHHHTVRDIRAFIDASRTGGSRDYQLQMMGFPPKQLTDLNQTIEQAGLANSVVIQKY